MLLLIAIGMGFRLRRFGRVEVVVMIGWDWLMEKPERIMILMDAARRLRGLPSV